MILALQQLRHWLEGSQQLFIMWPPELLLSMTSQMTELHAGPLVHLLELIQLYPVLPP